MLYPVLGTLSNVYGADHINNTLNPLRTVAVISLTGASKPTSILAHLVFLIQQCHCILYLNQ